MQGNSSSMPPQTPGAAFGRCISNFFNRQAEVSRIATSVEAERDGRLLADPTLDTVICIFRSDTPQNPVNLDALPASIRLFVEHSAREEDVIPLFTLEQIDRVRQIEDLEVREVLTDYWASMFVRSLNIEQRLNEIPIRAIGTSDMSVEQTLNLLRGRLPEDTLKYLPSSRYHNVFEVIQRRGNAVVRLMPWNLDDCRISFVELSYSQQLILELYAFMAKEVLDQRTNTQMIYSKNVKELHQRFVQRLAA